MPKTAARRDPAPPPAPASDLKAAVDKSPPKAKPEKPKESFRDFVEQIVVAIVLAVLIRGFSAEAFVIPTGSMAPTLKGRHKEITCPQCSNVYTVNSSEETETYFNANPAVRANEAAICDNCRFPAPVGEAPSFKGDRILVMKFPYEFPFLPGSGGPKRWDVVVFHYPEKPEQNYIKRLIGLPGEELRIRRGDVFVRPAGTEDPFSIARKPLSRQDAMAILVNDDRHRATMLKERPEWLHWRPAGGWSEAKEGVFAVSNGGGNLRYHHLVPDPEQWSAIAQDRPLPRPAKPSLITDFYAYNASNASDPYDPVSAWLQSNWVSDLLLNFDLDVKAAAGSATFELVEGGVKNRCVVDLATGRATLYHGEAKLGEAETRLGRTGSHSVVFANVDDRLSLQVDGRHPFGDGLGYDDGPEGSRGPTAADLEPVGIEATGASVEVSGLVLKRDIHYTLKPAHLDVPLQDPAASFGMLSKGPYARVIHQFDVLSDPAKFGPLLAESDPGSSYPIKPDHYFMMGDNSPRSADSRAWNRDDRDWDPAERASWEVPRELLIGKAFFVYWPHGVPFGPDIRLSRDFRIPFRPYIERMRPIR